VEIRTNCFDDGYHLEKRNTRRFVTKVSRKWLGSCFKSQCSRNSKLLHQLLHHGKWKVVHVLCGKKGLCRLLAVLPTFSIYNFLAFRICRHQNEYIYAQPNWEFWLWKFGNFYANLILREINFGWIQMVENCRFNNFEALIFRKISHLKVSKVPKNSKFRAAQMVKIADFRASKLPKLISRKIWVQKNSAINSWKITL